MGTERARLAFRLNLPGFHQAEGEASEVKTTGGRTGEKAEGGR